MGDGMYILDADNNPVPEPDTLTWARWLEANRDRKILKQTPIGDAMVSTVFLGIDHNWGSGPDPVLWETMIFHKPETPDGFRFFEDFQERYTSHDEAVAGHTRAVDMVLARKAAES